MQMVVYFAAPLFTQAERVWNRRLSTALQKMGSEIKIFLPQEETKSAIDNGLPDFAQIQRICLGGIESCDVILAILDGSDSDSGTSFECGYAFARRKRIIGVRTDLRAGEDDGLNAMLRQSCTLIHYRAFKDSEDDIEALAREIIEKI
jgi:nucleoside 2-deoxyribosyltransferase